MSSVTPLILLAIPDIVSFADDTAIVYEGDCCDISKMDVELNMTHSFY